MEKILVPTDFSRTSLNALKYAAELAKINNAKLYMLHIPVIPAFYINDLTNYSYFQKDLQRAITDIKNISGSKLDEFSGLGFLENVELYKEVIPGYSVYSEIFNYSKKLAPDIIVMGSHSKQKGFLFNIGSTTERVIRSTAVPVLIIKKPAYPRKIKKIVFASDFAKETRRIFQFVNAFNKMFSPEIHLLYINTKKNFHEYEEIKLRMIRFKKVFPGKFKIIVRAAREIDDGIVKYAKSINADMIALGVKRRKLLSLYFTDRIMEGVISKSRIPVLAIDNPR
jgi:nucleotide-binding universal stress UspA family protein